MRWTSIILPLACLFFLVDGELSTSDRVSCPFLWVQYTLTEPWQCLTISEEDVYNYTIAESGCQVLGGHLVTIFTKKKWEFVADLITAHVRRWSWLALRRLSGDDAPMWETPTGRKKMRYKPNRFYNRDRYGCVDMTSGGTWQTEDDCVGYRSYVCEREADCLPQWYGDRCEKPCHCHGLICDKVPDFETNPKCPYGCQDGWMGEHCEQKKEKASVGYHCVNGPDEEKYAMIVIDTKGVIYRSIGAVDDMNKPLPWCKQTVIEANAASSLMSIKIPIADSDLRHDMGKSCAGKHLGTGECQWRVGIKEWATIDLPFDQTVQVTCNFTDGENLTRTDKSTTTHEKMEHFFRAEETKEGLILELADAGTKKKLTSARLGAPVILKVRYGFKKGSLVKKVMPYNCEAKSVNEAKRLRLLDMNGCQVHGSPVKPFVEPESTDFIETPWFPYFTFDDNSPVYFTCSFHLCYLGNCTVGCNENGVSRKRRHARTSRSTKDDILA